MDGVKGAQLNDAQKKLRGLNLRKTPLFKFLENGKVARMAKLVAGGLY